MDKPSSTQWQRQLWGRGQGQDYQSYQSSRERPQQRALSDNGVNGGIV